MRKSLLLCFGLLLAVVAFSQGMKIAEPQEGATVRGEVPIRIEGAGRGYAYITLDGEFLAAINLPSEFKWDTQAPYGFHSTPVKDGEHTLAVKVYDGKELVGEAQVKITVKNKIEFPAGEELKLAYKYKEGEEHTWETSASREGLDLELKWKEICNEVVQPKNAPPIIFLTNRVENGRLIYLRQSVAPYPDIGNYFFLSILQSGEKADIRLGVPLPGGISSQARPTKTFGWGQLRIVFPPQGVKLKESWESPLVFVADIESGEPHVALAEHKIEDVLWVKGYKCLKIRSTFKWQGEISLGTQMGGGAGMRPGMTPGMLMPGAMGPGGMMPGMMGGASSTQGSVQAPSITPPSGAAAPQGIGGMPGMMGAMAGGVTPTVPVNIEGTRTTYFAFEEGKIVKIEDEIRVRPRIERGEGETSGATAPGRFVGPSGMPPGMMGPGMMGPGMMGPGMMGPGMMGPGGMSPGGMPAGGMGPGEMPPGMMGPGMMGPGGISPGGMPAGGIGAGRMGPMGSGAGGAIPGVTGMPAFAGGAPATPSGRAMGPFMPGMTAIPATTAYTLKVTSEMKK